MPSPISLRSYGLIPVSQPAARAPEASALDAERLWTALRSGAELVTASFCTATGCHLELSQSPLPTPLPERCGRVLDLVLKGHAQKVIALEQASAPSTIACWLKCSLKSMGIDSGSGSIPVALVNIAQAAWGTVPRLVGIMTATPELPNRRLISIRRPDPRALQVLSPAEIEIVELLIEGKARRQIAELRRTSHRTLANQLADVYRKLQVSGRIPLLIRTMQAVPMSSVVPSC